MKGWVINGMWSTGIKYSLSIAAVLPLKPFHGRSNDFACFEFSGPCLSGWDQWICSLCGECLCVCELRLVLCTENSEVLGGEEEKGRRERGGRGEEFIGYFWGSVSFMQIWEVGVSKIDFIFIYIFWFKYKVFEKLEESIKALTEQGILVFLKNLHIASVIWFENS